MTEDEVPSLEAVADRMSAAQWSRQIGLLIEAAKIAIADRDVPRDLLPDARFALSSGRCTNFDARELRVGIRQLEQMTEN